MADRWEDYFGSGEKLLWEGAPAKKSKTSLPEIALALFGIPFLLAGMGVSGTPLLAFFGFDFSLADAAGGVFLFFFGLPFLGFGAGMVFGPWYARTRRHKHVRYALSDRRAYIASRWWAQKMEVFSIAPDAQVTIEDGRSVYFHTRVGTDSDGDRITDRKGFENIDDASRVYGMIRDIQARDFVKGD